MQRPIVRSSLRQSIRSAFGASRIVSRYFRTFNGVDTYAVLNTPITFTGDFSITAECVTSVAYVNTTRAICGNSTVNDTFFNTQNTTGQIILSTPAGGVTKAISSHLDGKSHTITAYRAGTFLGLKLDGTPLNAQDRVTAPPTTFDLIGLRDSGGLTTNFAGNILSIRFEGTTATGYVDITYRMDNDSLTTQYAVGYASPSPNYLTYNNFVAGDIERFVWNASKGWWDWQAAAGTQVMKFTGSATTPLTAPITVLDSTFTMNWMRTVWNSLSAHTYKAAPNGENFWLGIRSPGSVTSLSILNLKLTGAIPSLSANTSLTDFICYDNQLTDYVASTISGALVLFSAENNLLPTTAVDQILSDVATSVALAPRIGTLSLDGTGNASPTGGASNADYLALVVAGWTVTIN